MKDTARAIAQTSDPRTSRKKCASPLSPCYGKYITAPQSATAYPSSVTVTLLVLELAPKRVIFAECSCLWMIASFQASSLFRAVDELLPLRRGKRFFQSSLQMCSTEKTLSVKGCPGSRFFSYRGVGRTCLRKADPPAFRCAHPKVHTLSIMRGHT